MSLPRQAYSKPVEAPSALSATYRTYALMADDHIYDTVVVGGGPAGLSAGLVLGRCMRHALLCDDRRYRNARSGALHCYMGHDGIHPAELLDRARSQLKPYDTIAIVGSSVTTIKKEDHRFAVAFKTGASVRARSVIAQPAWTMNCPPSRGTTLSRRGERGCWSVVKNSARRGRASPPLKRIVSKQPFFPIRDSIACSRISTPRLCKRSFCSEERGWPSVQRKRSSVHCRSSMEKFVPLSPRPYTATGAFRCSQPSQ